MLGSNSLKAILILSSFIRDRNNIKLTSSGERLIGYAEVMVSTLQQAKFELSLERRQSLAVNIGWHTEYDAYLQNCLSVVTDSFGGYGFMAGGDGARATLTAIC